MVMLNLILAFMGLLLIGLSVYLSVEYGRDKLGLLGVVMGLGFIFYGLITIPSAPITYSQAVIEAIRACGDNPDPVLCYMENGLEIKKR